ncbi:ABC transporter ATP-binding protein [Dokdonella sp.]|uniref:ABC transporter ATP-binding protein n=1 Tax=Dokdonella sp. TaxID=2291710 RepID=UPI0026261943|nr:ABC transporter ATP-binding protein [Dokdonella sp.]
MAIEFDRVGKAFRRIENPARVLRQTLFGGQSPETELFWALRDVSLRVERGEAVGVVGCNGSGKSTLLQLLCGVYPPTRGTIAVQGRIAALLELGAGFDPEFTGRENVYMNAAVLGMQRRETDARFDAIAAFADIGHFIDEPVKTYSSGMFVRLAFSVAVHTDPDILVVDEALAVGDARFQAKCMKRIKSLREAGVTLFFVSHDVSSVRTVCDRAVWLDRGRVVRLGSVFDVTAHYMEHLFADEAAEASPATEPPSPETPPEAAPGGPINHWGSHVGCIRGHRLTDAGGATARVFEYARTMRVEVTFRIPDGVDTAHLSVAFSIKDLKGTDLLVCTTHDENAGCFRGHAGLVRATFEFENRLTPGRYLLVLAVEDRSAPVVQYYEYIEGAEYFATASETTRFGLFNLPTRIQIEAARQAAMEMEGT